MQIKIYESLLNGNITTKDWDKFGMSASSWLMDKLQSYRGEKQKILSKFSTIAFSIFSLVWYNQKMVLRSLLSLGVWKQKDHLPNVIGSGALVFWTVFHFFSKDGSQKENG